MMTAEQLKASILQMAMQGKLVEQRAEEGTGDALFHKIQEEKKVLLTEGKIRKDKKQSQISEDEIPFNIPETWCWGRLSDLCDLYTGNSISESVKKSKYMKEIDGYSYIATKDVRFDHTIDYQNGVMIPFEDDFRHAPKGSVLMCIEGGSAGRKIGILDREVCFGNKLCMFNGFIDINKFLYFYLQSSSFTEIFKNGITGIIGGVSINKLKTLLVPLPPLEEQKRIVAKIEELMPFVEQYAKASTRLNTLNASFPDQMKKSILQQAVMGKLVPQDPNDEPASVLLKKIAEEKQKLIKEGKIKKLKALLAITEEEIPFDIPESWKWVRLNEIIENVPANGFSPKGVDYQTDYKNLTLTATTSGTFKADAFKYVDITKEQAEKYFLKKDDILIQRSNSRELVGTACLYTEGPDNYIYPDLMMRIHALDGIWPQYLVMTLQSPYVRGYYQQNASGSSQSMPKINQSIVGNTLIPIPPLHEQKKIVQTVNGLIPTLSSLC